MDVSNNRSTISLVPNLHKVHGMHWINLLHNLLDRFVSEMNPHHIVMTDLRISSDIL